MTRPNGKHRGELTGIVGFMHTIYPVSNPVIINFEIHGQVDMVDRVKALQIGKLAVKRWSGSGFRGTSGSKMAEKERSARKNGIPA
jgi:hypothetical protein